MNAVRALVKEVRDETLELVQSGRRSGRRNWRCDRKRNYWPSLSVRLHCAGHRLLDRDHYLAGDKLSSQHSNVARCRICSDVCMRGVVSSYFVHSHLETEP